MTVSPIATTTSPRGEPLSVYQIAWSPSAGDLDFFQLLAGERIFTWTVEATTAPLSMATAIDLYDETNGALLLRAYIKTTRGPQVVGQGPLPIVSGSAPTMVRLVVNSAFPRPSGVLRVTVETGTPITVLPGGTGPTGPSAPGATGPAGSPGATGPTGSPPQPITPAALSWVAGMNPNGAVIFEASVDCVVTGARGRVTTPEGSFSELMLMKVPPGSAVTDGHPILEAPFDSGGAADVVQVLTLASTGADLALAPGDCIGALTGGGWAANVGAVFVTLWPGSGPPASAIPPASANWLAGVNPDGITVFIADEAVTVTSVDGRIQVAEGSSASVTLYKAPSGTLFSSGTPLTTDSLDADGTPAVSQVLTPSSTPSDLDLAVGDSIVMVTTGSWTASIGIVRVGMVRT